ncbi:MAG: TrkH family potassium uptake protein [Spirochaetales bacterium]|nr:TrkH family potassium uptake protein [Spirochaetales bacterium]
MKSFQILIIITLVLCVILLFLEEEETAGPVLSIVIEIINYLILGLVIIETLSRFLQTKYKALFFREYLFSFVLLIFYISLFAFFKFQKFIVFPQGTESVALFVILIRNSILTVRLFARIQKLSRYLERFTARPALTMLQSFLYVILSGTFVLMMGFTTQDGNGLHFIDSLFTATSAVCVTGLIVVDTATHFTIWGQLIILVLIQIGGLGIMILSFSALFALRRKVSLEDKLLLSYMLSEEDMSGLSKSLANIISLTIILEFAGAVVLFIGFIPRFGLSVQTAFLAVFHSVSAFCNAGFALFSNSLEMFRTDPLIVGTIAVLIILGGISFSVIMNVRDVVFGRLFARFSKTAKKREQITLNTRVVIRFTLVLLTAGIILVYFLEHGQVMADYNLGEQYLSAFFQSVTLRTAGFNTIPFGSLAQGTALFMIVFMFIGAASGGTAGGIKINTFAVILARLRTFLQGGKKTRMGRYRISDERVSRSFIVLLFGIASVIAGSFFLTLFENADFLDILFEATSAFGTVGLSTGITAALSVGGKIVIIILMYFGRLGPITILSAASNTSQNTGIEFPRGDISIG